MTLAGFLLLLLTAVCMALANILLKAGVAQSGGLGTASDLVRLLTRPAFIAGFLLTAAGAVMWLRILSTQKLSTCYPVFVSLTYFLITLGALYFLHEKVSLQKLLGLVIIVVGITTVARG